MKKIILGFYFAAIICILAYILKPSIEIVLVTALISIVKFAGTIFCTFDQTDKKEILWFKIIFLVILNVFSITGIIISKELNNTALLDETTTGLTMLLWTLFLSIIGIDLYMLYCYFFEKNKNLLLLGNE